MKKVISLFLAFIMSFSLFSVSASASDEDNSAGGDAASANSNWKKADYIGYVFPYRTTEGDLKQGFIDAAVSHVNLDEQTMGDYHLQVYGHESQQESTLFGGDFLVSCANAADLLDCRTFARTESCEEQLSFLRDVNGFAEYSASDCAQFAGGEYTVAEGDIIFWMDDNGSERAVNVGIVNALDGNDVHAIVCNVQKGYAELILNSEEIEKDNIGDFLVVNPEYPCYERLVFFYLINELDMGIPSACGIMCNIYHESAFEPDREEELNALGYGPCQWSRTRRQMLQDWCAAHNRDYTKLYSQLDFMIYELSVHEPDLLEYLQGPYADAYNAGYKFCIEYECPDGGEAEAQARGNETITRFCGAYSGHPYM